MLAIVPREYCVDQYSLTEQSVDNLIAIKNSNALFIVPLINMSNKVVEVKCSIEAGFKINVLLNIGA